MKLLAEERLVLLLARGKIEASDEALARRLLATPLRWELIVRMAGAEAIYPLMYTNLRKLGFGGVPTEIRTSLGSLYRTNALRNTLMARELESVLSLLSDAGVPAIPLKGLPLAEALYGDRSLRVCVDMDILIPFGKAVETLRRLRERGYESEAAEEFFENLLLTQDIEYQLSRPDRVFVHSLELHWALLWGPRWDERAVEDLWVSAKPMSYLGAQAYGLSREWEFLYLCAHAARHRWRGLKWLVDIHELCSSTEVDWAAAKAKATAFGWAGLVEMSLAVCHSLFGTQIPTPFALRSVPSWLHVFPTPPGRSSAVTDALVFARLLDQPSRKLKYLVGVGFVPTLAERRLIRLPRWLSPLYYLIRPLRLAVRWTWRVLSIRRAAAG